MTDEIKTDVPPTWDATPETSAEKKTSETKETIKDTKTQLAEMYLNFLDKQKEGILATSARIGVNLNPLQKDAVEYLTTDKTVEDKKDFFWNIGKTIKKKFMEKLTWWTMLEYKKTSLNNMKVIIWDKDKFNTLTEAINQNKDDETKLQELMSQIEAGTYLADVAVGTTTTIAADQALKPETKVEYSDKTNREKVLVSLDAILAKDAKKAIPYVRWGKDIDTQGGVDCSWLLYDTIKDAWLNEKAFSSRSAFLDLETKLVELDENKKIKKDGLENIQKWDFIFWNSTNPDYKRSVWNIPAITKDGKEYRIHHIAFVDKINYDDGTIDVVESNGAEWVTKNTVNVNFRLTTEKKYKSELYVAHVNYDTFAPVHTVV